MKNNYRNYEKNYSSPERKRRPSRKSIRNFALIALLAMGIITGASKLASAAKPIDYDSDGVSFHPNGGIPEIYFDIANYSEKKDSAGQIKYEYNHEHNKKGDEIEIDGNRFNISFGTIKEGNALMIEEDGSFRTSPVAGNIEKLSTILLSNQDMVLNNVNEIGFCDKDGAGDNFYMIHLEDAPEDVQEYIAEKEIELPEIGGKDYIFISYLDAEIVDVKSIPSAGGSK